MYRTRDGFALIFVVVVTSSLALLGWSLWHTSSMLTDIMTCAQRSAWYNQFAQAICNQQVIMLHRHRSYVASRIRHSAWHEDLTPLIHAYHEQSPQAWPPWSRVQRGTLQIRNVPDGILVRVELFNDQGCCGHGYAVVQKTPTT